MISVEIKGKLNFPQLNFQGDLTHIANTIIIPTISDNIHKQKTLDNKRFPALERSTIAYKKKKKLSTKILIATGKLVTSFIQKKIRKDSVLVTLNSARKEIGGYLQIDGINSKSGKKHFNFFGISTLMETEAMIYMRKRIVEELRK